MGGAHIDVTTLKRNAHFFSKMQDLQSKTLRLFVTSQSRPLVWMAKYMDVLRQISVFNVGCKNMDAFGGSR